MHPSKPDSAQCGGEHGLRGRTSGSGDVGGGTPPPHGAARDIETTRGILSSSEIAPLLALNVLELEERIEDGAFTARPLDDELVLEFQRGRLARAWLREIIRRLCLPPVRLAPVESAETEAYLSALRAADRNDWRLLMAIWRDRFARMQW